MPRRGRWRKNKKAPGLAGQEQQVGAYRQVATHIHVREVNKSVAALPGKVVGRISREVAPSGITDLHGQRFQQRKGLFHAVFTDDKRTQLAFVVHPSGDHPLCFGGDVPVQIAALGFPGQM